MVNSARQLTHTQEHYVIYSWLCCLRMLFMQVFTSLMKFHKLFDWRVNNVLLLIS